MMQMVLLFSITMKAAYFCAYFNKYYWLFKKKLFSWILLNLELICVIDTVPIYLGKWGNKVNFSNSVTEIQQKYKREREKVGERKF